MERARIRDEAHQKYSNYILQDYQVYRATDQYLADLVAREGARVRARSCSISGNSGSILRPTLMNECSSFTSSRRTISCLTLWPG